MQFGDQYTLVVYDEAKGREHFVRLAHFQASEPFSFVVPTPSLPEIAEADPEVFSQLYRIFPSETKGLAAASAGGVVVRQTVDVGSCRAETLEASSGRAIEGYLKKNGYKLPEGGSEWLESYAKKGWLLTALKLRKPSGNKTLMEAVRFSFDTKEPFNPYFVPKGNLGKSGNLTMYTLTRGTLQAAVSGVAVKKARETSVPPEALARIAKMISLDPKELQGFDTLARYHLPFAREEKPDITFTPAPPAIGFVQMLIAGGLGIAGLAWAMARARG